MIAALLLVAASHANAHPAQKPAEAAARHGALVFLEDDYAKALAQAKAQKKPVFIDFWATWCHSCLSMQRYVLADAGMKPVANDVVWLSIETEQEKNKDVVEKFPLDGWPTFLIIDPVSEKVLGRWLGSGSVQEMRAFVHDNAQAYRGSAKKLAPAAAAQRDGDQARIRGDFKAAADAYGKAVELSKADDAARPERLTLYVSALRKLKTPEALKTCAEVGLREMDKTGDSAVANDFASYADACGQALPKDDPARAKVREAAMKRIEGVLAKKGAPLAADDRSDALATLADMYEEQGDAAQSKAMLEKRAAVLEQAAKDAPDATLASTFDAHRTDTYLALKQPEKAEALLSAREKEVPADYNPPARLARVYFEEKKLPEAEAAVDRALSKMTKGQRRVGVLGLKAKILAAQNKPVDDVVKEQLEVLRSLPATQRNPEYEKKLEASLVHKPASAN